jgi:hypothetical protein
MECMKSMYMVGDSQLLFVAGSSGSGSNYLIIIEISKVGESRPYFWFIIINTFIYRCFFTMCLRGSATDLQYI